MDRFLGFDLGDAESAVAKLNRHDQTVPEMISVQNAQSFITACAVLSTGELLIGENACYAANASRRKLRFKSRFLTDPSSAGDIRSFAAGVLGELYSSGELIKGEDSCFYIGCPAGWNKNAREEYREIFERVGYPPVRIISESRAALVSACQSRHLQFGLDILSHPVLVIDIGSSTTDFAYICSGHEVEMQTAGEVRLGGGIMDELLLEESIRRSPREKEIRKIFRESEPWRAYCEFAARRLKERYYSDMDYWKEHPCTETVLIRYDRPVRLTLEMNEEIAEILISRGAERLEGKSFYESFRQALLDVRSGITDAQPELLFLTGGVSKLPLIRKWCLEIFPDAVAISGLEPEFSVARGLAWCGRIDEELRDFRAEIEELRASDAVENLVKAHINELYRASIDSLVDPILENAAIPVFERWRNGEIRRLADTDEELEHAIASYLRSDEVRQLLVKPISSWLKKISGELEELTVPICVRHQVPYKALSLTSYLDTSAIEVALDARDLFAVQEVTLLIDSIISILVALICGGSGIALISTGPTGLAAGVLLSLVVLLLGRKQMESAILQMDLPRPMRKMIPSSSIQNRISTMSGEVREQLKKSLEEEKNDEISERLINEISEQIESCLTKMAEVVEIPLT